MIPKAFDFDVALSYAREDRSYVQQVAALLQERDIRVFYDEYALGELWGNDLYVLLDEVYRKRARFAVVFVSRHYASKPWTQHERQSAQARSLKEIGPYLLPVRLDDSELPGLRPTVSYIDARSTSPEQLVHLIAQKLLTTSGVTNSEPAPVLRSPRTAEQQRELLARRPKAWEYLLYAGVLWQRRYALESKWLDHELGYARPTGRYLGNHEAFVLMSDITKNLRACVRNMMKMLDPTAQTRAFGPPGQPGDPALIEHIATRLIETYEEMLDAAATLRGIGVSAELAPVMEAAARITDMPLREIRDFIDQLVTEVDSVPERLTLGKPVYISLILTLTTDNDVLDNFYHEMAQTKQRLGI